MQQDIIQQYLAVHWSLVGR